MAGFVDSNGKQWDVRLTIGSVKRVRSLLGVDLMEPDTGEPSLLTRMSTDPVLLCDIVYALLKPQADDAKITDEMFGESLGGDAVCNAVDAFYEEYANFFQTSGRADKAREIAKIRQGIKIAVALAEKRLETLDIEAEIHKACGEQFTNLPESSG